MLGTSLEHDIISLYAPNVKSLFSINQISLKLNKKYPYINKKVTSLIHANIFRRTVIGRSHLCSLNLGSEHTRLLLCAYQMQRRKDFIAETGIDIHVFKEVAQFPHAIVAVDAEKTIYIITESEGDFMQFSCEGYGVQRITRKDFALFLKKKDHPLYTEPIVLYGAERFYELLASLEQSLAQLYSPLVIA